MHVFVGGWMVTSMDRLKGWKKGEESERRRRKGVEARHKARKTIIFEKRLRDDDARKQANNNENDFFISLDFPILESKCKSSTCFVCFFWLLCSTHY